jgi:hypothetical protein
MQPFRGNCVLAPASSAVEHSVEYFGHRNFPTNGGAGDQAALLLRRMRQTGSSPISAASRTPSPPVGSPARK